MAVDSAYVVPASVSSFALTGGVVLTSPRDAGANVMPLPTLSARFVTGLTRSLDLRVRYDTVLGLTHRVGLEARATLWQSERWALALSAYPSAQIAVMPYHGLYTNGDVSTHASVLVSARTPSLALTLEGGATMRWVVIDYAGERTFVDPRPRVGYVDASARIEWSVGAWRTLMLGVEVSVATNTEESLGGTYPRVFFGGTWSR